MSKTARMIGVAAAVSAVAAFATASPAAAGTGNEPTLSSFAFTPASIDATTGAAVESMTWSVTDKNRGVGTISGAIMIRQQGPRKGTYVGSSYNVTFSSSSDGIADVIANPGSTAASSSYTYHWPVPQYTNTASATWVVTEVTLKDDKGSTSTTGTPAHGSFIATDLVDSTAPAYLFVRLSSLQPDVLYVGGGATPEDVQFFATDDESGLASGATVFTGPDGTRITTPFSVSVQNGVTTCGADYNGDIHTTLCDVNAIFPATATPGTWTLSELDLTDHAGNTGQYTTDPSSNTVLVTADTVVQASNFALTPSIADNSTGPAPLALTMDITGATGGITSALVIGTCAQPSTVPTDLGGGEISIGLYLRQSDPSCEVTGLKLTDGAGNVSVYGAVYGAPALSLVSTAVPVTTAP